MIETPTDADLVARLRRRDHTAVADLVDLYSSRIRQLALRYLRNEEDADEVVQDVLFKVYQKIDAFRGDSALSSWIYRITFNTAMSRLRTNKSRRPKETADRLPSDFSSDETPLAALDIADWSSLADDELLRRQLRQKLVKALGELPEIYRVPVLLRDVHGLTTEEASAVLQVKDETLKSRLHRGRLILRNRLAEFAGGLALRRPQLVGA